AVEAPPVEAAKPEPSEEPSEASDSPEEAEVAPVAVAPVTDAPPVATETPQSISESEPIPEPVPGPETDANVVADEQEATETTAPVENPVPEAPVAETPATDPNPEVSPPVPAAAFFDVAPRAEARLEALEATAIETPVEPEPAPTAPAIAPIPTSPNFLEFDDGFRWSAEILAAQGRRPEDVTVEEISWLQKLRFGLGKTRLRLVNQLKSLVGQGPIDAAAIEEIEAVLLQADVGIVATDYIVESLQERVRDRALPPEEAVAYLKDLLREILTVGEPSFAPDQDALNIWLMVGVNGAGKTTTLGKLAHLANKSGYRTLVAAADTFRAAAVEQVQIWGDRAGVEVIANQGANTDPAAVVFDAISAARARETELLLVDTAGRLQNKKNLMDELTKIRRIVEKKAPEARVESLLVLDATLGQNGMRQAEV
ncbi:MAG: signal recognition particle receptor subunit alpha, partial [Cyanobacteria bacterium J06648_11]